MIIAKVVLSIVGILFIVFGYLIYFKKKYSLINGFIEEYKVGKKTEEYAKKVGIVELIVGIIILIVDIILIIYI